VRMTSFVTETHRRLRVRAGVFVMDGGGGGGEVRECGTGKRNYLSAVVIFAPRTEYNTRVRRARNEIYVPAGVRHKKYDRRDDTPRAV